MSISCLIAQHHTVCAVDLIKSKVDSINNRKSPIQDEYIEKYLAEKNLDLTATLDGEAAYRDADFVVIAAPTNYDSKTQHFDTVGGVEVCKARFYPETGVKEEHFVLELSPIRLKGWQE